MTFELTFQSSCTNRPKYLARRSSRSVDRIWPLFGIPTSMLAMALPVLAVPGKAVGWVLKPRMPGNLLVKDIHVAGDAGLRRRT